MSRQEHWDAVYRTRDLQRASWYQQDASVSIELLSHVALRPGDAIIDVGGGASPLVTHLVAGGFDVTVVDISQEALDAARRRLGEASGKVSWVCADIAEWQPDRAYRLWHDRACLHFLVDDDKRDAYVRAAANAVASDGYVMIGVFAPEGPAECSGLPVRRYDTAALTALFGDRFRLVANRRELHHTPSGAIQSFVWVVMARARSRSTGTAS